MWKRHNAFTATDLIGNNSGISVDIDRHRYIYIYIHELQLMPAGCQICVHVCRQYLYSAEYLCVGWKTALGTSTVLEPPTLLA